MKEWLAAYAAGTLRGADRDRVRVHLADCPRCRADLAAWKNIADALRPGTATAGTTAPDPERLVRAVLTRSAVESPDPPPEGQAARRLRHLAALMVAEARLIRPAVPIASALVIALGVVIVLVQATTGRDAERTTAGGTAELVLALIAPIVAAAGVAGTYRSGRDPAAELIAATPGSGLLLLVRLALVFGYDLAIAVVASVALAAADVADTASLNTLVGAWLGPMALLSSLSLLIAVRFGSDVALSAAVGLWAVRVLAGDVLLSPDALPARVIVTVWSTNAPVLAVSAAVALIALLLAGRFDEPRNGWRATHPL
ncbi:anti-sigma factor family protein [Cryptosporangium aurantiacum]|uniref:Putative zinc-finger n=1 Tax=Cryptosporangium aurantiacum TaxID=134849 RepID=A0A1M7TY13_9ACTN|nr:zf-HC2 domain-containing protein [Cryptosporangium aurantiacum]SHN75629.1 Putative zinc-finger [Cryptosporangium aurantiacum]